MTDVEITDRPRPEEIAQLEKGLADFMRSATDKGETDRMLGAFVRAADGSVVAGLIGMTGRDQLFVHVLFVSEKERRRGLGTKLMLAAEREARARECCSAWLMTSNPDAKVFYEKLGYHTFGKVERRPPSEARHFLAKVL
jgi:GNAT superfamily N-acetyltransferase